MKIPFTKYQGTGNDFIVIDNRNLGLTYEGLDIPSLCDRHFGIGADGLILLENHVNLDFLMRYFNADGSQSFCGNGSRCAIDFAQKLGIVQSHTQFESTDGTHEAEIFENRVHLSMHPVTKVQSLEHHFVVNTGSPHYIIFVPDIAQVDIIKEARQIRYHATYRAEGINVNFVASEQGILKIRTYERGVENETLSCGTGVTAVALANHVRENLGTGNFHIEVLTLGGKLEVRYHHHADGTFDQIYLSGPAKAVYEGNFNLEDFYYLNQKASV